MERAIAVLAPSVYVSVTIEAGAGDDDDIHIHAGGQGIWVARMLRQLGHRPTVCSPVGGEPGQTLLGLIRSWGIEIVPIATTAATPAYVHDRREGERVELARSRQPELHRHELDELYNRILERSLSAGTCVVTGPAVDDQLPVDLYRRLGADLASAGVAVVGDLHGDALLAFLEGGPLKVLKVSAGDLTEDGLLDELAVHEPGHEDLVADTIDELSDRGVEIVVVSRGDQPALTRSTEGYARVHGPALEVVDATGSGDSMTAALTASLVEDHAVEEMLRRAWAAGAANVTRHGLGSGVPELIAELSAQASVEPWDRAGS